MQSGRLNKARRGELALPLPTGYVRRRSGDVVLDPDEQVRAVVRLVFDTFAELRTTHGVLRYLVDHGIEIGIRLHEGPDKGELEWRRPNRMTLQNVLHSPVYAGIYAYGRRRIDPRRQQPGRPGTGRVVRGEDEWLVFVPDALPAYISVEQYHANLAQMKANASRSGTSGTARAGSALLSGVLRCGMCGKRMTVMYHVRDAVCQPEYRCARLVTDYGAAGPCQSLSGACLDAYVSTAVLAAVAPPPCRPRCRPPARSGRNADAWKRSGPHAWNARPSTSTAPGAATGWQNRRTASSSVSWRRTGRLR